jgi:hypothetical protein
LRELDLAQRLLQIDDVDAVALGEDEPAHLRIPPARLVTEVHTRREQLLERRMICCGLHRGVSHRNS